MGIFKTKGVSRIEQPEKNNFGWYVRARYKGEVKSKFFADKKHGGRAKAFQLAKSWYKKEMRKIMRKIAGHASDLEGVPKGVLVTVNKNNNTGVVGVQKIVRKKKTTTYKAYRVTYKMGEKYKTKFFSIEQYGDKEAFEMARQFKVTKLLEQTS